MNAPKEGAFKRLGAWWSRMLVVRAGVTLVIGGAVVLAALYLITSRGYRFNMQWDKEKHFELVPPAPTAAALQPIANQ